MTRNDERSRNLYARAVRVMPGGVNSPVRSFRAVGGIPRFIVRAHGARLVDADGNEYIDYVMSWGPSILGHAHPEVVEAVQRAAADGLTYGAPTAREVEMAETVRELMSSMEVMRLVNSGTEAVLSAVRLARGFTRREKIVTFRGCYHGHSDSVCDTAGVPRELRRLTLHADYNDLDGVARLFAENRGEIAAVVVEPVGANNGVMPPAPGFLEGLRALTAADGALLVFDEVITGFRLGLGGAQGFFGVRPDLTTLGKIVGGGLPCGAFGGRTDVMRCLAPDGPVYQAGTLSGNPLTTAAGLATLRVLRREPGLYAALEAKARRLEAAGAGGGAAVRRVGSLLSVTPPDYPRFFHALLARGVYVAPAPTEALFLSAAHTEADIAATCDALGAVAGNMV